MDRTGQGLTLAQAAKSLGVSSKTVRRFIKAGKVHAELVEGPFGLEYRIWELPADLGRGRSPDTSLGQAPVQTSLQTTGQLTDIIRELQEKNLTLAVQLGMAHERIKTLESELRLLNAAKDRRSWWKRLLGWKS